MGAPLGSGTITGTIIGMEAGGSETGDAEFCGHSCCLELDECSLCKHGHLGRSG